MQTEDVIELGSSDEEPGPPPPKKINVKNAMVHIPTKFHGVTIKPVAASAPVLPKLGKNITITKTTSSSSSKNTNKIKPPDKPLEKLAAAKKKTVGRKLNHTAQAKGKVFNPLSQPKKCIVPAGNATFTKQPPILVKKLPMNKLQQPIKRLPPSITIKKTGTTFIKPAQNMTNIIIPKIVSNVAPKVNRKRKIDVVQTVELDDDEASSSSNNHQWYVRPEDQTHASSEKDKILAKEEKATSQEKAAISQEDTNNKEPEGPKYIEITIEDSPIKPAKIKRTRELSTEKVITIDDSPNKGSVVSEDVTEASDGETNTVKKVPHSKKKLKYASDLQRIEETQTIEIEIEPIERIQPDVEANEENRVISLTPEIMEVEQASVEIAQNEQGAVSIVQNKPLQPKQNAKAAPKREVAVQSEFHPTYQSFISLCIQLENSNDMEKIIEKKIKPYYRQVPKEYTESEEFLDMVSSKITAMEAAPEKMYLYIKDIVDELNLQRKFMKQMPVEEKSKDQDDFLYGKENELDPNKQRQIRKLEKTLKKLNRAIQKLENQEVDFDDEEDSVYLLTEKYKERMVRVHAKFCQLTNTKMPSQPRLVIDPRPGLSAAPAKRLEAWINKKYGVVFPDFHDVLRCVREANEQEKLGWNEAFIMEEARDLFVRCGRKLQRRRQENEWRIATSRIQPNSDPAEQSDDLKKQLEANRRLANTKETELFDKFCDRQSQLKLEAEEIDDKEAEESPVESEEEDNDDSSSLESKQKRKDRLRRLLQEQSKKTTTKGPQTEQDIIEDIECVEESTESVTGNKCETVNDEDKIQSLSDDSNEIGSDMDELHLLQKLHSDNEIRTGSTSDSGSETPIAISDSLDSSSNDGNPTKQQPGDVISIENSSYSDESDSHKSNNPKTNKKHAVSAKDLIEESKEIECTSSSVVKNTDTLGNTATTLSSSDSDSNADDNTNSEKSGNSSKVSSGKEGKTLDKDFELNIMSDSTGLCINMNDNSKPSDVDDEQSMSLDITPDSSASSGQYEQLLKEHNADPLLKAPELIPQDPSDKLFDSLVIKHYNDPLIKKTLKDSIIDSPFPPYPESSNSDTQSTNAPETVEEVKRDLIESSVDTEELLNSNSPSMQIVDKLIEKLKNSEGSQSSNESLFRKVDRELDLNSEAISPITHALEKEVNLARQTKSWPRFRDECSSFSSADDDNTGDESLIVKPNESTINDSDVKEIPSTESKPLNPAAKDNEAWNCESKCESENADFNKTGNTSTAAGTKDFSEKCTDADASESERTKNVFDEMDVEYSEMISTQEIMDPVATSSKYTKNVSEADNVAFSSKSPEDTHGAMDITESETSHTEATDCTDQAKETDIEVPVTTAESLDRPDDTNEPLMEQEDLGQLPNSNIIPNSGETEDAFDSNHDNDNGSELVSNGNLNINMDISELLHSDTSISQKSDGGDKDLGGDEEAIPRTISSVCSEGHD